MDSREDWYWTACDVHSGKDLHRLGDAGKSGGNHIRREVTDLEEDVVFVGSTAPAGGREGGREGGRGGKEE